MKRKLLSLVLTLALLTGMMSVMGAFPTIASAEEVTKFTANFFDGLDANAEFQWAGGINYNSFMNDPEAEGATAKTKNSHAWMSERFDSYICMDTKDYANFSKRSYFGQYDSANSYFLYSQREGVHVVNSDRGLLFNNATTDSETFWHINTLVPKVDGEQINVQNFEATVKFAFLDNGNSGGLLFAFHEAHPGRYIYNWNYSEKYNSGSVLAIGNKVDGTVGNDAWKFFDKGAVLEDEYLYGAESLGKNLSGQYYTLTVKAVNGNATFTLAGKDGAVVKTMTTAYTSTEGGISIGVSGRAAIINEITVTEISGEEDDNVVMPSNEFDVQFSDGLNRNDNAWVGNYGNYTTALNDPSAEGATEAEKHYQDWLNDRFDSYMSFHNIKQRTYFGQADEDGGSHFAYAQRIAVHVSDPDRSLMHNNASPGGEVFWSINTIVPKHNGKIPVMKNFEATLKFAMTNNLSGGMLVAFHETTGGQYTFANSYSVRKNSGAVLAIGNNVDAKASYGGNGSSTDAWKFYADGAVEAGYMTNVDKNFGKNLSGQWYTLTVRVVNGTATFTLVSADGTLNETMTKSLSTSAGAMSIGFSGREVMLNHVNLVELDNSGMPVDIGTYMVMGDPVEIEGLPAYTGGKVTAKDGRDGVKTYVLENTSLIQYKEYLSSVEEAGWIKHSENEAADNLFATYQKDGETVYIYYLPAENRTHIIDMPQGALLPDAQAEYTKVCEPLFTQVQLSYATASEGMSYLVRLSDGRFIVIDGGDDEADYLESKHLYNLMKEQNVLDKITVAAWIVTHAHGDHQLVPTEFMNYYSADDLTIEQVLFNYPVTTPNAAQTNAFIAAVDAWGATGTKRVTPYIGQEYHYADAKIEFLHSVDAYAPGQLDGEDFNNTSLVFTIELGGQKIMILGDMHTIGNDQLVKLYGSYLKSDISQWAHHGVGGATRELYVEIDPAVVVLPAGVFHHTNTYNYYRYHAPATDRTAQSFKWLYYPQNDATNHVKEVFLMGFKEVTLQLPYTSAEGCEYMANRNNNGYVFEEAAASDATVPNPFYELNMGENSNVVKYKDKSYKVPSKRVEKSAAVESYNVSGLSNVLNGNNSFELFVAIDTLPDVLTNETYYMFGTSTSGLTLERNTLNVSMRRGESTAIPANGGRYHRGNVVGGNVVNHIVGTYDAATNTLAVYKNGVLISTATYTDGYTAEDVLNLGSASFNSNSGYTVLGARVYDVALSGEQVAATYWKAIDGLFQNSVVLDTETNTITVYPKDGYELKAGSLLTKDAQGKESVPTRVGFRNGGTADKYLAEDSAVSVSCEFIQPTLDNPNIGMLATSFNREQCGLRFIYRFTRRVIDGVEYVVMSDGSKYPISDYGMLLSSEAGLNTTAVDTAEDMVVNSKNLYVKALSVKKLNKYYDICDEYIDMSACIINLNKVANFDLIKDMKMYARAYVIIEVDGEQRILYGNISDSTYAEQLIDVSTTNSVAELREAGTLLVNGRHIIADETTNKGFVEPGDIVVDFGNAGITIAGDLAGDIYMDVAYNMYAHGECRINVMVDGAYVDDVVAKYGNNTLKVVSGLKSGYHTVKITKGVGTPAFGDLIFKNITYNGFLETPTVNDFQIEFLGDSITDTVGILSSNYADALDIAGQTNPTENVRLGYSALTAQALGADFTLVSMSGNSISMTSDLFKETTWKYQGQDMPYTFGSGDTTEKDVVVINLGTNGLWGATDTNIATRRPEIQAEVKECLTAVRAKYPNAYIVWTYGMLATQYEDVLSDAVAEWASANGDTKTSYCSLVAAANTQGAGMHPLAVGHENAAKILTQYLADLLDLNNVQSVTLPNSRPLKVACVGDSITSLGYWQNNLQGELFSDKFEVQGFGKSGATASLKGTDGGETPKAYMDQTQHADSLAYGADIVVMMLGTNDSKPENWPRVKDEFVYDYVKLVRAYQNTAKTPYVYIMAPLAAYENIFSGINDETIVNEIIPALQKVAKITGAKFVMDTHTATSGDASWTDDGVHPSEAGKSVVAKAIANVIKKDILGYTTVSVAGLIEEDTVRIDGRHTITQDGNVKVSFGNAGITIAGELEGDIYLDVQYTMYAHGECRINVMVDGVYVDDAIAKYGDNRLKIVSGLEGGNHTVKISKGSGTPSLGDLVFKNISYNGYLEKPAVNELQFMFIGDSITDTAGILGAYADAPDQAGIQLPSQNIRLGYAALTSNALGADFTQVSLAGNTIPQMLSLFKEEPWQYMGQTLPYIYGSNDTVDKDVVVINLGTNVSSGDMKQDVKDCLTAVRAQYPNAHIVWAYGMMFTQSDNLLSTAVAEWVAQTGDTKTTYCSLTAAANTEGGAQHPLAFAHEDAAQILTAHIADLLGINA